MGRPVRDAVAMVCDHVSGWVTHLAGTLRGRDLEPVVVTRQGAAPVPLDATIRVVDDVYDANQLVTAACAVEQDGLRLRGMLSCQDGVAGAAAHAARRLGLPHPVVEAIDRAHDKYRTRVATSNSVPSPGFGLMRRSSDARRIAHEVGLPAVIKPIGGTASHLVRKVGSPSELADAYEFLADRVERAFRQNYLHLSTGLDTDPMRTFLVEEFVAGPEYCADVVVRAGTVNRVSILKKFIVTPEAFFEEGFLWSADERSEVLWEFVDSVVKAVGLDECLAHIELVLGEEGPRLIEVNAGRMGGLLVGPLAYIVSGIDLAEEMISCALGAPRPTADKRVAVGDGAAALVVFMNRTGEVTQVPPGDAVAELPNVISAFPMCTVGQHVRTLDFQVPAYGVLTGGTADETVLRKLHRRLAEYVDRSLVMAPDGVS